MVTGLAVSRSQAGHDDAASARPWNARRRRWPILAALFLAGFSGLVYEVVWTRILSLILGGTVIAGAAVLCAFMGGLAVGSWVSGRWADGKRSRALSLMAVQLAVAAVALALMPVFAWLTRSYVWAARALQPSYYTLSAIRVALAVLVLLLPAALIAAAFPLVARLVVSSRNRVGEGVALVYGVDTMGAVTGAAIAGFVLLRWLGVAHSVQLAAALNLVSAGLAFVSRSGEAPERERMPDAAQGEPMLPAPAPTAAPTPVLSLGLAVSGGAALCYEVLTQKALVHLLTMSFDAFCIMLTCFLLGLGVGSLVCMALIPRPDRLLFWFGIAEAGIAVLGLSLPLQFAAVPYLLTYLQSHGYPQWSGQAAASAVVLLPLTSLMGATLPLLVAALTPSLRQLGRSAGTLYSINTLGGVAGVVVATFVLLPFAGFKTGMAAAAGANLVVALVALHYSRGVPAGPRWGAALLALGLGGIMLLLSAHSSLRSVLFWRTLQRHQSQLLFYREGQYGTVAVARIEDDRVGFTRRMFVNASDEGGTDLPSLRAFQLLGNLPFLLHQEHSRPKDVLVCAFGMGITLGVAANEDSRSVDCVELVPEVLEAGRYFAPYNHDPTREPKVKVHLEDARNFLLATPRKFDIVIMDATHPRTGDSWMLYTQECYQLAKRALAPGGVCAQWVPRHSLPPSAFWSIIRTFQSVFPHVSLWSPVGSTHNVVVGTSGPQTVDFGYLASRLDEPAIHRDLEAAEIPDVYTFLSYFVAGEKTLARASSPFPLNTDDLSPVQFADGQATPAQQNQEFADLMESPIGMISDWGAGAQQKTARAFEAARLVRQALASPAADGYPGSVEPTLLQRAHELNPKERDAAVWLGIERPRLRSEEKRP